MSRIDTYKEQLRNYFKGIHWGLLLFLLLVLNVKLVVKVAAIIAYCFYFRKEFRVLSPFRQRHLFFYYGMILAGISNLLLHAGLVKTNYSFVFLLGLFYWGMAAAAGYFLVLLLKHADTGKIHRTITFFFILHFLVIAGYVLGIMIETGSLNPYVFKGMNQKYFINTGDYIRGITWDSPITTAFISSFAVLYFLYRHQYTFSLLAMAALLLQVSNLAQVILVAVLGYCLVFQSTKQQKSIILIHFLMMLVFLVKVSPQNGAYLADTLSKITGYELKKTEKKGPEKELRIAPDSTLTPAELKMKLALLSIDRLSTSFPTASESKLSQKEKLKTLVEKKFITHDSLYYEYSESKGLSYKRNRFTVFINENYDAEITDSLQKHFNPEYPGKFIALQQTVAFFKTHPARLATGNGIGNFSSRLAFKATLLGIGGSYPARFRYIHPDFKNNHLFTYAYFFSLEEMKHSVINTPDSTVMQIGGEYGLAGLFLFAFFYLGFFLRHIRKFSYGIPVLLFMLSGFFIEYWFEQLSVVILFELLLMVEIKSSASGAEKKGGLL